MSKLRLAVVVLVLGAIVAPQVSAGPYFRYMFKAKRDGHVWIWRTYNGTRVSPDPAIDEEMLAGDSVILNADQDYCNDADVKWENADGLKKSNFVGQSYDYNTFEGFLGDHPGVLQQFTLTAVDGREIDAELNLDMWYHFLQSNPLPDPAAVYDFVNGTCPALPGYTVTETSSGLSFTGLCETELDASLRLVEAAERAPVLSQPAAALLALFLLVVAAAALRRKVRA